MPVVHTSSARSCSMPWAAVARRGQPDPSSVRPRQGPSRVCTSSRTVPGSRDGTSRSPTRTCTTGTSRRPRSRRGGVVGAGHCVGVPRPDVRPRDRRGVAPGDRQDVEGDRPRRDRHTARRRLSERGIPRGRRPHCPDRPRGHVRLGEVDEPPCPPGAVVAAGHGVGLPRGQLRTPDRRGHSPHDRQDSQGVRPGRDRNPARGRCADRRDTRGRPPHRRGGATATVADRTRCTAAGQSGLQDVRGVPAGRQHRVDRRNRRLATCRHRRRQRPRQRPRPGARAVTDLAGRQGKWRSVAQSGHHRSDIPGAVVRSRPRPVHPAEVRHRLRLAVTGERARHSRGPDLLVGRMGRFGDRDEPRPPRHVRLRDEQDGSGDDRHRPNESVREAGLRGPRTDREARASRARRDPPRADPGLATPISTSRRRPLLHFRCRRSVRRARRRFPRSARHQSARELVAPNGNRPPPQR